MPEPNILEQLVSKLKETGLAELPGSLLYSSLGTVKPGKIYLLGYNPGGDPSRESASVASQLRAIARHPTDWNAYIDEQWSPGGRTYAKGEAPMQKRVRRLLEHLGLEPVEVCASNLIFARSRLANHLSNGQQLAELCWAVHQFILDTVRPKVILSIGGSRVLDFIVSKGQELSETERICSGHGNWACLATHVQIDARSVNLISIPHVGRYAVDQHPEVLSWVAAKAGLWN